MLLRNEPLAGVCAAYPVRESKSVFVSQDHGLQWKEHVALGDT